MNRVVGSSCSLRGPPGREDGTQDVHAGGVSLTGADIKERRWRLSDVASERVPQHFRLQAL